MQKNVFLSRNYCVMKTIKANEKHQMWWKTDSSPYLSTITSCRVCVCACVFACVHVHARMHVCARACVCRMLSEPVYSLSGASGTSVALGGLKDGEF